MLDWLCLGYIGVLSFSFLIYLIPFVGPSTMVLAGTVAVVARDLNPIIIGICISTGSSVAKTVHYYVTHFAKKALSERSRNRLESYGSKLGRWRSIATFVASSTPIPDEPVLVALALMRFSPLRFFISYFLGKIAVTIPGAYVGSYAGDHARHVVGSLPSTISSIAFTIVLTIILVKWDIGTLKTKWRRCWSRLIGLSKSKS